MRCPHCDHPEDHVIDSRPVETANVIRRRRECLSCARRFTTYERCESIPLIVLKSDHHREPFDREKIREGLSRAFEKRDVSMDQIEKIVSEVESEIQEDYLMEVPSRAIGDLILKKLKGMDLIAYIRFVSVYKQLSDVDSFLTILRGLKQEEKAKKKRTKQAVVDPISLSMYSTN